MQVLRDAVWQSNKPSSTLYNSGDHIICVASNQPVTLTGSYTWTGVNPEEPTAGSSGPTGSFSLSGNIAEGGICLFAQNLKQGPLTLSGVRLLVDKLLEHGCGTCGSVPVHFVDQNGNNDPSDGILTFNYVAHPYCTGNCISGMGVANPVPGSRNASSPHRGERAGLRGRSQKFASLWREKEEVGSGGWVGWLLG